MRKQLAFLVILFLGALILAGSAMARPVNPATDNVVNYYPLDGSIIDTVDSIALHNTGADLITDPALCKYGSGCVFGNGEFGVDFGSDNHANWASSGSESFWFRFNSSDPNCKDSDSSPTNTCPIRGVTHDTSGGFGEYGVFWDKSNDQLVYWYGGDNSYTYNNTVNLEDTRWHLYTHTWDATNGSRFYMDDKIMTEIPGLSTLIVGGSSGCYGAAGCNQFLYSDKPYAPEQIGEGFIDDLTEWGHTLGQAEITNLYTDVGRAINLSTDDVVNYYPLNGNFSDVVDSSDMLHSNIDMVSDVAQCKFGGCVYSSPGYSRDLALDNTAEWVSNQSETFWFKFNSTDPTCIDYHSNPTVYCPIRSVLDNGDPYAHYLDVEWEKDTNELHYNFASFGVSITILNLTDLNWHLYTHTWDDENGSKFYMDGVFLGNISTLKNPRGDTTCDYSNCNNFLFSGGGGVDGNALIDDIARWGHSMGQQEITDFYAGHPTQAPPAPPAPQSPRISNESLAAFWKLNGTLIDYSGHGHDMSSVNAAYFPNCVGDVGCYQVGLEGHSYLAFNDSPEFDTGTNNFTFSCLVLSSDPAVSEWEFLNMQNGESHAVKWRFFLTTWGNVVPYITMTDRAGNSLGEGYLGSVSPAIPDDRYVLLTYKRFGQYITAYINDTPFGMNFDLGSPSADLWHDAYPKRIGYADGTGSSANVSFCTFFNRDLSADELTNLTECALGNTDCGLNQMAAEAPTPEIPVPLIFWRMDENEATIPNEAGFPADLTVGTVPFVDNCELNINGSAGCYNFSGAVNYMITTNTTAADIINGNNSLTFQFWVRTPLDDYSGRGFFEDINAGNPTLDRLGMFLSGSSTGDDQLDLQYNNADITGNLHTYANISMPPNEWQLLTITWNATDGLFRVYQNGTEVAYTLQEANPTLWSNETSQGDAFLLFFGLDTSFDAQMKWVQIWRGLLTPEQMVYYGSNPPVYTAAPPAPPEISWTLDNNVTVNGLPVGYGWAFAPYTYNGEQYLAMGDDGANPVPVQPTHFFKWNNQTVRWDDVTRNWATGFPTNLPDIKYVEPAVGYVDGVLSAVVYSYNASTFSAQVTGHTWDGTEWILNDTLINGIPSDYNPSIFDWNGKAYFIYSTGGVKEWNGTGWMDTLDLLSISLGYQKANVINGNLTLIGMNGHTPESFVWNGTDWEQRYDILPNNGNFGDAVLWNDGYGWKYIGSTWDGTLPILGAYETGTLQTPTEVRADVTHHYPFDDENFDDYADSLPLLHNSIDIISDPSQCKAGGGCAYSPPGYGMNLALDDYGKWDSNESESFWFKFNSTDPECVDYGSSPTVYCPIRSVYDLQDPDHRYFDVTWRKDTNELIYSFNSGSIVVTTLHLTDLNWHLYVHTWDDENGSRFYIDKVLVATNPELKNPAGTQPGDYGSGNNFLWSAPQGQDASALIDSITRYGYVLGENEITTLYDSTVPVVLLHEPTLNQIVSSNPVTFNCTAYDNIAVANTTLFVWNSTHDLVYSSSIGGAAPAGMCYQENPMDTNCGGGTGSSIYNGNMPDAALVYDGNYATGSYTGCGGGDWYLYINYSKPAGATNAIIQLAGANWMPSPPYNHTLPDACFNAFPDKIAIRYHYETGGEYYGFECLNDDSNTWYSVFWDDNLAGCTTSGLTEEAVYWNISATAPSTTLPVGDYKFNCLAFDTVGNSAWAVNRSFAVDLVAPTVTLISPTSGQVITTARVPFNATATDDYRVMNRTLYVWNSTDLMPTSPFIDPGVCYQENPTDTNCGAGTGSTVVGGISNIFEQPGSMFDGNYGTPGSNAYINYTKPRGAENAIVQLYYSEGMFGAHLVNTTVPDTCFNANPDRLSIYYSGGDFVDIYCMNSGGSWQRIRDDDGFGGAVLMEEAIYWSITDNYQLMGGGNYTYNFMAQDAAGKAGWGTNTSFVWDNETPTWDTFQKDLITVSQGNTVNYSVNLADNAQGSYYQLFTNDTGAWVGKPMKTWTTPTTAFDTLTVTAPVDAEVCAYFWFNDTVNNQVQTSNICFVVNVSDTRAPGWTSIINNAGSSTYHGSLVTFSANLNDDQSLSGAILEVNDGGTLTNSSVQGVSGTTAVASIAHVVQGTAGVQVCGRFFFNDTSNKWNVTDSSCFTVQATPPVGGGGGGGGAYTLPTLPTIPPVTPPVTTPPSNLVLTVFGGNGTPGVIGNSLDAIGKFFGGIGTGIGNAFKNSSTTAIAVVATVAVLGAGFVVGRALLRRRFGGGA